MNEQVLDRLYTELCHALTRAGETRGTLLLGRFALLAMLEIGDEEKLRRLLTDAADFLHDEADVA